MKNRYTIFYLLMFLPLIITSVLLQFFPETVPIHFDASGNITSWGNKYLLLVFPLITVGIGYILKAIAKSTSRREEGSTNEKVIIIVSIGTFLLFNVMTLIFLYYSYFPAIKKQNFVMIDLSSIIFSTMGIIIIVMGNILPKSRLNSIVGIRTKWSMVNERSWFLSQRIGGIMLMLSGLIITLGNILLFKGMNSIIFSITSLVIVTIIIYITTYVIYKKVIKDNITQ